MNGGVIPVRNLLLSGSALKPIEPEGASFWRILGISDLTVILG